MSVASVASVFVERQRGGSVLIRCVDTDGTQQTEWLYNDDESRTIEASIEDNRTHWHRQLDIDLTVIDGKPEKVT